MTCSESNTKICSKCQRALPFEQFNKHKECKDGLRPDCKDCGRAYMQAYKEANAEKLTLYSRQYYQENKERIGAYQKTFQAQHADSIARYHKEWRKRNISKVRKQKHAYNQANKERNNATKRRQAARNRERFNQYSRDWRARNPERRRAVSKQNKAKRRSVPGICTPEQWLAKCEYWGWRCYLCSAPVSSSTMHMEHRIPLSRGGTNWPANLAPACHRCNLSKNSKTEAEFRALHLVDG